ncbi:unnamed protein product [Aphanomyces euteiches]
MVDSAITNHNLSTAEELLAELNPHASVSSNEDPHAPLREEPVPSHPWVQNIPSTMNGHSLASNATRRNFGSLAASEHDDHQRPNDVVTRADMFALFRAQSENLIALIQRSRNIPWMMNSITQMTPTMSLLQLDGESKETKSRSYPWSPYPRSKAIQKEEMPLEPGFRDLKKRPSPAARPVQDWFAQLDPRYKVKWNTIRSRFVKEFVQSPIPNEEIYYTMKHRPGESNKAYLFRFNAAARKINLDYVGNRRNLRLHIKRYARALMD